MLERDYTVGQRTSKLGPQGLGRQAGPMVQNLWHAEKEYVQECCIPFKWSFNSNKSSKPSNICVPRFSPLILRDITDPDLWNIPGHPPLLPGRTGAIVPACSCTAPGATLMRFLSSNFGRKNDPVLAEKTAVPENKCRCDILSAHVVGEICRLVGYYMYLCLVGHFRRWKTGLATIHQKKLGFAHKVVLVQNLFVGQKAEIKHTVEEAGIDRSIDRQIDRQTGR